MSFWSEVLKDSRARVERLKQELEAAKASDPRYVISIMPDTQVAYGAKPETLEALKASGVPIPQLPQGFGFAMEAAQLTETFSADDAAVKVADLAALPELGRFLLAIVRLDKWIETRIQEQQHILGTAVTVMANESAAIFNAPSTLQ